MNHEEFEHVVRAAGGVLGVDEIIVIGTQALLASVDAPPPTVARSVEVAVVPTDGDEAKADLLDGSIGEASMFQDAFGVHAQGVGLTTAVLPEGWRERLVPYRNQNTGGVTALCLDPTDLVVSKLVAGREKDLEFCREVLRVGLVSADEVEVRVASLGDDAAGIRLAGLR